MEKWSNESRAKPRKTRAKYYRLDELKTKAEALGCSLTFDSSYNVFTLTSMESPALWGFVLHPHSDLKVTHVRSMGRKEWDEVLKLNVERILM